MDWLDHKIEPYVQFCKTKYKKPTLSGLKLHLQDWQYRGISNDELWARLAFLVYILKDKKVIGKWLWLCFIRPSLSLTSEHGLVVGNGPLFFV